MIVKMESSKTPFIIKRNYLLKKVMKRLIKKIFHYYVEVLNAYGEALCR